MSCSCGFSDYIAKCNETIKVYALLPSLGAYQSYQWLITDKFDNKFTGDFQIDTDGFPYLDVADLPDGLLTQFSGDFTLEVLDGTCKPVKFKVAQEYDSISFHVKPGTQVKDTLGCDFDCISTPSGNSTLVTFEDQSTLDIEWNGGMFALYGNTPLIQVFHEVSPGTYQTANVAIQQTQVDGLLTNININNGGVASGYVVIST